MIYSVNENIFCSNDNFIFNIALSIEDLTFMLPLISAGTYDFVIDWGDGEIDTITQYDQEEVTHTYASAGNYKCKIKGTCEGWYFYNTESKDKFISIENFDNFTITGSGTFYDCINLEGISPDAPTIIVDTLVNTFRGCASLGDIRLTNWDVSNIKYFNYMFFNCPDINPIVFNWDVSNAISMTGMFRASPNANPDVSNWQTLLLENTSWMFFQSVNNPDVSKWNTQNLSNSEYMFYNASNANPDISDWDIQNITSMKNMMLGSRFSNTNYESAIISFKTQAETYDISSIAFHAGTAELITQEALDAKDYLQNIKGWTITDGS